jgi:hypothetical protein
MPRASDEPGVGRKVCETIHLLCAGLWLGSLVMSAITAGILFTRMRELEPSFGAFAAYPGEQSNLGAGYIQNGVFLAGDIVQFIGATGTLATLIAMLAFFGLPLRRVSSAVRLFAQGGAMLLVSYHLFILVPRMQENAQEYWRAAAAGEAEAAETAHAAFDADHPTARNVLAGTALCVAVLLGAGAWSATSAGSSERRGGDGRQEPDLARIGGVA